MRAFPICGVWAEEFNHFDLEDGLVVEGTCSYAEKHPNTHNPQMSREKIAVRFAVIPAGDSWQIDPKDERHLLNEGFLPIAIEMLLDTVKEWIAANSSDHTNVCGP